MDKTGVLYTYDENFRALKAFLAAAYSGVKVEQHANFRFGETNKTDEFLAKFPGGRVPAYESKDGKVLLSQSDAIAYYLSDESLRGVGEVSKAQVIQWTSFAQSELLPVIYAWLFPSMSIMAFNKDNVAKAKSETERLLTVLDNVLLTKTYLVGESVTLADISVFATVFDLYKNLLDAESRTTLFVNVTRWFDTILNQTKVKETLAKHKFHFSYCVTPVKFDPAKLKQVTGGQQPAPKKAEDKKKKEEKKPKEPAPKKEKEIDPAEEMDEAEAALAAEPKSKDPLDALPKGSFVMDDFKRFYSNNEVDQSIPYFWEKFDPENYSIWFGEYKYNSELSKVFMSCNLIMGMFQRLDKLRKNAFASVCLFGEDNNNTISGVWVFRGQDLAFTLSPDWQTDYETYSWVKLDPASPDAKKLVKDYFSWEGTDKEGRKFNQGKVFK